MIKKFEKYLNYMIEYLGMSLLVLMTIIVAIVVFSRYLFHKTPSWGEEGALLCMVWFGFLSMAIGTRDDLHIRITMFDPFMSDKTKHYFDWINRILVIVFSIFMFTEGIKMCQVATGNYMPGIGLNSALLYAAVPLSGIAIFCYMVANSVRAIISRGENK